MNVYDDSALLLLAAGRAAGVTSSAGTSVQLRQKFDALLQVFQNEDCFIALVAAARVFDFI
jgi:hypothetical protein